MRALLTLGLVLTLPGASAAADLKVTVIDRATGSPIAGATVNLKDPPTITPGENQTTGRGGSCTYSVVAVGDNFALFATAPGYYSNGLNVQNWNGLPITLQLSKVP
jgi:hypothetical protein